MSAPGFGEGVGGQPQNLLESATALRDALGQIDLSRLREGTIVFSGIGASWHALLPAVRRLQHAGRRAFAVPVAQLAGTRDLADSYVLVSQSGASTEMLAALEELPPERVLVVSARADSPLVQRAAAFVPLSHRRDSAVSTLSYTATLQALGMISETLLGDELLQWERVAELLGESLERNRDDAAALGESLAAATALDAVGAAGSVGSAGESALLVREGLHLPASAEETRQYLHGPLEAVRDGFCCLLFGAERELELGASLAGWGARVCVITSAARSAPPAGMQVVATAAVPELAAPILEIAPVQLAVADAGAALGLPLGELERQQSDTKQPVP
jgi:glutamine---fructose-6-phosphate transaminase (isomerizing)